MSIPGGEWGNARWGGSLWGFAQTGIVLSGTLISASLRRLLNQDPPREMRMRPTVLLDGIDISPLVESGNIRCGSGNDSSLCQLTIIGNDVPGLRLGTSRLEVGVTISTPEGDSVTGNLFRGFPRSIVPATGSERRSVSLDCFDEAFKQLRSSPQNMSFSGTTIALLAQELVGVNITQIALNMGGGYQLSNYNITHSTVGQLVKDVASSFEPVLIYSSSSQTFNVKSYLDAVPNGWKIPLSAQTQQGYVDSSRSRFNRVIVPDSLGSDCVYDDFTDQAEFGVMETRIESNIPLSESQALAKAERTAKVSMMRGLRWETPVNPFIRVGDCIQVQLLNGSWATVLMEEVTHQIGWPNGFWSSWQGKIAA